MQEATARIKINKLLEAAGWRFFPDRGQPANIRIESGVTIKTADLDALGSDFEKTAKGFVDFLLLDNNGFPLIVLKAKAEDTNPFVGKEQARKYARSQNCRFVILSHGNLHCFWDLARGNPCLITAFPTPDSVTGYKKAAPDPKRLVAETAQDDYIVLSPRPTYQSEAGLNPGAIHKRENVVSYLSKPQKLLWRRKLQAASAHPRYANAERALHALHTELGLLNASATRSLDEGRDETLTLHRLGVFATLGTSFKITNLIESEMARVEATTHRVGRWRTSDQKQRWCAATPRHIETNFRRVKCCTDLALLQRVLELTLPRPHQRGGVSRASEALTRISTEIGTHLIERSRDAINRNVRKYQTRTWSSWRRQ